MEDGYRLADWVFLMGLLAVGVAIPTVVAMRHVLAADPFHSLGPIWGGAVLGSLIGLTAGLVTALNVYLYLRTLRAPDEGGMSGIPIFGGVLIVVAGLLLPPSLWAGVPLLALYAFDPLGIPWAIVRTLRALRSV